MSARPSSSPSPAYLGRFAPSPTGPLHFGSFVTALASFLQARQHEGQWRLRIDDIDPARQSDEAIEFIPRQLAACGLQWDGDIIYQSQQTSRHFEALQRLLRQHDAFGCACTRREVAQSPLQGPEGGIYTGTCRHGVPAGKQARSVRMRVQSTPILIHDPVYGAVRCNLAAEVGDFVIQRADGAIGYQLAAAVDDAYEGYSEVVRGADLLSSSLRQRWLQQCLQISSPHYMHLPLVLGDDDKKLSKQTHAPPLDIDHPRQVLVSALTFLQQKPPKGLHECSVAAILNWAVVHWKPSRLRGVSNTTATDNGL